MYINTFVAGFITAIIIEIVVLIGAAIYTNNRKR